jgi:antibiotic biosynthesis monooxygenase (ABM) superfamily enzyme
MFYWSEGSSVISEFLIVVLWLSFLRLLITRVSLIVLVLLNEFIYVVTTLFLIPISRLLLAQFFTHRMAGTFL